MSQPTNKSDAIKREGEAFDKAFADTADELGQAADQLMDNQEVQQGLDDPERDDSW